MSSSKEYGRQYYLANKDKMLESNARYVRENPEKNREKGRQWRAANLDKARKSSRERLRRWRAENRERYLALARKYREKKITHWAPGRRDEFLEKQKGLCALCDRPMKKACSDHDHETGRARALLCTGCNSALGFVERPGWLDRAVAYVNQWKR